MKHILYILVTFAGLFLTFDASGEDKKHLDGLQKLIRNSFMEVKWVNPRYFHYTTEDNDGKVYHIVDTRNWKQQDLTDREAFAARLEELSQGGGR